MTRKYLVYIPAVNGIVAARDLFSRRRKYDVAINDYRGNPDSEPRAEHCFHLKGHKWWCIYSNIELLLDKYEAFCFLDEDVEISANDLNALLDTGRQLDLAIWQASLTPDSCCWWRFLFHREHHAPSRPVPLVEIMMPCFSRPALRRCLPMFRDNYGGGGLDLVWSLTMFTPEQIAVIDSIQARHSRPARSDQWLMPNGKRWVDDGADLMRRYGVGPLTRDGTPW